MDAILDARLGKNRWNQMRVDKKMGEVLGKGACRFWEGAVEMAWKGLVWVL